MKRMLILLLAVTAAVTLLAGCSSPKNNPTPNTEGQPETTAPADETPNETPNETPKENTELPNPFTPYDSIEELKEKTGIDFSLPTSLPEGFELTALSSLDQGTSKVAQASFSNGAETITYRVAQGTSETNPGYTGEEGLEGYITFLTGDFNQYGDNQTLEAGTRHVTLRGNDGKYSVAFWEENGNSFSIVSRIPLDSAEMRAIIESIQ